MREDFFVEPHGEDFHQRIQDLAALSLPKLIIVALSAEPGQPFWLAVGVVVYKCKAAPEHIIGHVEFADYQHYASLLFQAGIANPQQREAALEHLHAFYEHLARTTKGATQ